MKAFWTEWHGVFSEGGVQEAWINTVLCPPNEDHPEGFGLFCPLIVDVEVQKRIPDHQTLLKYWEVQRQGAEIELRSRGCLHEIPTPPWLPPDDR